VISAIKIDLDDGVQLLKRPGARHGVAQVL
jgi:hypothetical protein